MTDLDINLMLDQIDLALWKYHNKDKLKDSQAAKLTFYNRLKEIVTQHEPS